MPPSRLMLQHAATSPALPVLTPKKKEHFTCHHCEYSTPSKLGLVGHIRITHKEVYQSPTILYVLFAENILIPK